MSSENLVETCLKTKGGKIKQENEILSKFMNSNIRFLFWYKMNSVLFSINLYHIV